MTWGVKGIGRPPSVRPLVRYLEQNLESHRIAEGRSNGFGPFRAGGPSFGLTIIDFDPETFIGRKRLDPTDLAT